MIVKSNNPWGKTGDTEHQRSDLWSIDMSAVATLIFNPSGVRVTDEFAALLAKAASANWRDASAISVTLPEASMAKVQVTHTSVHTSAPGYDDLLQAVRIEFFADVAGSTWAFLRAWHMLTMAGRQDLDGIILPLLSESSKPKFKADLPVQFLRGATDGNLAEGAELLLSGAWLSQLQAPETDNSASASNAVIIATLQVDVVLAG